MLSENSLLPVGLGSEVSIYETLLLIQPTCWSWSRVSITFLEGAIGYLVGLLCKGLDFIGFLKNRFMISAGVTRTQSFGET